jgi:serine/threonine protein kinase
MTSARQIDRYELLEELGRGGMAVVYLARQRDLDRYVALKELSAFHRTDAAWTARFLRESRLAGSLAHANIVTVHDYLQADGTPYIAMEYLRRGSLRPFVGALTTAQIGGVLGDVLAGLEHAEKRGIVHRDLKPENLLVTEEGRVKITDFGIAKATTNASFQTQTGIAVGTPAYMAPEQALAGKIGPWSDLYSVGCMAYELFVGRLPFMSPEPMALMLRHINEPAEPAAKANPALDPGIAAWVDALLAKEPSERPSGAAEAWDALEETLLELLGPRWRRGSALPELKAARRTETPAAFMSSIVDSSAFVDLERRRSAASLLTPPPGAGTPSPSVPDALPGPYTPPPDAPVPASLVEAARSFAPASDESLEKPAPPMPSDVLLPAPENAAATARTQGRAARGGVSRRFGALVGAVAVLAGVVGVALLGSGEQPAPAPAAQAAQGPVATPRALEAGAVRVTVPGDWQTGRAVPEALAFADEATGATAPGGGGVVAGLVPTKAVGASLLAFDPGVEAEPVQLGSLSAYRYAEVQLGGAPVGTT